MSLLGRFVRPALGLLGATISLLFGHGIDICRGFALHFCRPLSGLLCRLDNPLKLRIVLGYLAHIGVALDGKLRRASQSALKVSSE